MLFRSSNLVSPSVKELILFPLILADAKWWKNLVFLSPSLNHLQWDLWLHLIFSSHTFLRKVPFNCSLLILSFSSSWESSSFLSSSWISSKMLILTTLISPKWFLAHSLIFTFLSLILYAWTNPGFPSTTQLPHHSLISPDNSFSSSHISSKRKGEGPHLSHCVSSMTGQWSNRGLGRVIW